jgi:hypothetical protein
MVDFKFEPRSTLSRFWSRARCDLSWGIPHGYVTRGSWFLVFTPNIFFFPYLTRHSSPIQHPVWSVGMPSFQSIAYTTTYSSAPDTPDTT